MHVRRFGPRSAVRYKAQGPCLDYWRRRGMIAVVGPFLAGRSPRRGIRLNERGPSKPKQKPSGDAAKA
eukprot:5628651-Lingulodinium_polyedra.AAC.1